MEVKDQMKERERVMGRYLTPSRRLRLDNWIFWSHHKAGWKYVLWLVEEHLHSPDGTRFVSSVEDEFFFKGENYAGAITEPWVGFVHQAPQQNYNFPDLERIVRKEEWKESLDHCQGLWVLTDYQKNYLLSLDVPVPVAKIHYPTVAPAESFSFERFLANPKRRLLFVGEYLRNFQAFYDLMAPGYEKTLLRSEEIDRHMGKLGVVENDSVTSTYRVDDQTYDRWLAENIVFLNLFDAVGTTTVMECIASGTPILINKVGAVTEYLGEEYPFYYDTLEEATHKASDLDLIQQTAGYLRNWELREKLTADHFVEEIQNTAIYRSLPVPRSQRGQFKPYDVSLIICSYKRVYNLERLLTLLTKQDFTGSFEVFLWNNNIEALEEVSEICRRFEERLALKVMHCSENLYCQVRVALANLVQSDLILICDDDVLPQANYISTFLNKYRQYGPKAVICARGHVFYPHTLNEEQPQRFWENFEHMKFFDESVPDRQVHFMHADNCLIPTSIMKEAALHEMEQLEYALIDDYWLSYVLQARLSVPIWKIQAEDALEFTECADDPDIALFHNVLVNQQRVNFYISHTRKGWPSTGEIACNSMDVEEPKPEAPPVAQKRQRVLDSEQLAEDIFDRQIIINPATRDAFFLQLAAALVRLPKFFLTEDEESRKRLLDDLRDLIEQHGLLGLRYEKVLEYLKEAELHLTALAYEPPLNRTPWQSENIAVETDSRSIARLVLPDVRRYYNWLGSQLEGFGHVVELGGWLGATTSSIAEGLSINRCFAGAIHVFDFFRWEGWMRRAFSQKSSMVHSSIAELKVGDNFINLFREFCAPYKKFIEVRECIPENGSQAYVPFAWDGRPIELFVYDFGDSYESIKQAWDVFAPAFVPGKTVVTINSYGNLRAEELRRFCRDYRQVLKPIHKPRGLNKGFLFTGGANS